jgi:hypothetical protein
MISIGLNDLELSIEMIKFRRKKIRRNSFNAVKYRVMITFGLAFVGVDLTSFITAKSPLLHLTRPGPPQTLLSQKKRKILKVDRREIKIKKPPRVSFGRHLKFFII